MSAKTRLGVGIFIFPNGIIGNAPDQQIIPVCPLSSVVLGPTLAAHRFFKLYLVDFTEECVSGVLALARDAETPCFARDYFASTICTGLSSLKVSTVSAGTRMAAP